MDPGGSDLEPELSQLDNSCLIVEDSQPDSAVLEEDPDSSYRALLSRRLSSLQPTSHSPVLELMSSPAGSRCSQTDSQSAVAQSNTPASVVALESSSAAEEVHEVHKVSMPGNQERDPIPANSKCSGEHAEMEAGVGSTTHSVQSQELSCAESRKSESQNSTSARSEVSSSCEKVEEKGRGIQELLHAEAQGRQEQEAEEGDAEVLSSQDDMFEVERGEDAAGVDSTVPETGALPVPTSTPANSLHVLHLSGQGTLVQESLSQSSAEFVAPSQDDSSHTPVIVPSSPTALDEAGEEPMDTSLPPDELVLAPGPPCHREEEPMEMDQGPGRPGTSPSLAPASSTPISSDSPGVVLDKALPMPSPPDLSHDVFVPTQSQEEDRGSSRGTEILNDKVPSALAESNPKQTGASAGQSEPSVTKESIRLELSVATDSEAVIQHTQQLEERNEEEEGADEDSQATQIVEPQGTVGSASTNDIARCHSQLASAEDVPEGLESHANQETDPLEGDRMKGDGECAHPEDDDSQVLDPEQEKPAVPPAAVSPLTAAAESVKTVGDSQGPDAACPQGAASLQQELETVDLTVSSSERHTPPVTSHTDDSSARLASQTESLSVLSKVEDGGADAEDVEMGGPSRSPEEREVLPEHEEESNMVEERMEEGDGEATAGTDGSGLCLILSQSQVFSPEPMDEDDASQGDEQNAPAEPVASVQERMGGEEENKAEVSTKVTVEVAGRNSQQRDPGTVSVASDAHLSTQTLHAAEGPRGTKVRDDIAVEKLVSSQNGLGVPPEGVDTTEDAHLQLDKSPVHNTKPADRGAEESSESRSPADGSTEIPFHFTLPKDGELIRPIASVTPPLISQLKPTPIHSTPIEMGVLTDKLVGDISGEPTIVSSDTMVEESREESKVDSSDLKAAEHDGKLSLRMKLTTPVEEASSGSDSFSLQKPALSDEESSVSKVTTVVKAVTSSLSSPSVFSQVCEVRRQVEAGEIAPPSEPCSPSRGNLFNSPPAPARAPERDTPAPLTQKPKSLPRSNVVTGGCQAEELSPCPVQDGPWPQAASVRQEEELPCKVGAAEGSVRLLRPDSGAVFAAEAGRTPLRHRAVSQQTSFDTNSSPSFPSTLRQRAVSQQTSFDTLEPSFLAGQREPETPPPLPPANGQSVRRHVRTIREVRTTVTRIITDVYYENGQEVDRKVTEESEEPVLECRVAENDISPSRTGSSMTSGDLADVSSLSSKASSLQHSSSGTSSSGAGAGQQPDFAVPMGRGAKSSSPRKGNGQQQQGPPCVAGTVEWLEGRGRAQGSRPHTPLTPRGRGRRGRPPSRGALSRAAGSLARDGPALSSSPEEESYTRVCPRMAETPGGPDSPGTTSEPGSDAGGGGGGSSFVGLRVVAKWSSNGYFYSGCITRDSGAGRFRLLFDDSYECDVLGKDILLCDPIPLGTEVTALSDDGYFSTGVVKGHKKEGSDFFYCVEKDNQRKWYRRMAVILSMEQGNRLREQYGLGPYEPTTPLTKASDISLDNLVEGKRKRRSNVAGGGTPARSSSEGPRTPGPSGKRKLIVTTAEEDRTPAKRGRRGAGPRSGQRGTVCNTSGSSTDLPSDSGDLEETHGPLPQNASLFIGYVFLLTTSSERDREANQPTSDAEDDYVETAPYNKRYTESQLKAGGGYILCDFNKQQCSAAYQSIMIADQHCRTQKYLLCMASGMPCVSHMWVRDCCHDNQLLNFRNYLLPAGTGPDGRIVEWHPRSSPFKALNVLLVSEEASAFLAELLTMGGASAVHQHKADSDVAGLSEETFDVVVTDRSCPPAVLDWATSLDLPLLAPEWLIQSLICGQKQEHTEQPQYRYDYCP